MGDLNSEVIKQIKKLRVEQGLSQEKLSELSKLDPKYINKLENGRFNLTLPTLERILGGLKIDSYLFFSSLKRVEENSVDEMMNMINNLDETKKKSTIATFIEFLKLLN